MKGNISYARQSTSRADARAVARVVRSSHLAMGPMKDALEHELRSTTGASFAVAVSSGTAALHAAYAALGVGPGDEVIVPAITFASTATTVVHRGGVVKFADVDPVSGLIDVESVKNLVSDRTKAVVSVDYAGRPAEIQPILDIVRPLGIRLVADAAHSLGSSLNGVPVGSLADVTCLSLFATKNVAAGEGGGVVTNSSHLAEKAREFASHGIKRAPAEQAGESWDPWVYDIDALGLNYRPSELQAALAVSQIKRLGKFQSKRQKIFDRYVSELAGIEELSLPVTPEKADIVWHLFPIRVDASIRRDLFTFLHQRGIIVQVNYLPVYFHSLFGSDKYPRGLCPSAELFYSQEISLPIHAGLSSSQQMKVISSIRAFFRMRSLS